MTIEKGRKMTVCGVVQYKWSVEERAFLDECIDAGLTPKEVVELDELDRSYNAINRRVQRRRKEIPPANHYKPWSEREYAEIRSAKRSGKTPEEVYREGQIARTIESIRTKMSHMHVGGARRTWRSLYRSHA